MIPIDTIALFFVAAVALALAPGPDNIFVLTQSALYGRKAGILVTLGLSTGLIFHTTAVALGVVAIFETSAVAFNALKIAGATYLLYLAWQAFKAGAPSLDSPQNPDLSSRRLYLRGVVMNITNPKVAIFFLAFLPQFAAPKQGSITLQILQFGGIFIIATLLIFSGIAWLAGSLGNWLKTSKRTQIVMNRLAGSVFVALALKLLLSPR